MRALLLAAVLLAPDGDKPRVSPLKPLCAVAKQLEKGMADYLKGATVTEAFKPWDVGEEKKATLRDTLKAQGVQSAPSIGFELYISFVRKGALAYRVRIEAWVSSTDAGLFILGGGGSGTGKPRGLAVSACRDQTAPFGEAATAFAKAAKTGKAEALPFADRAALEKLVPEAMREGFLRGYDYSKKDAERICAEIAKLDFDEVWVDADDQYTAALDAEGRPCGGMIRTKFNLRENGVVEFHLGRYESR